jgi:hypothetical protein
VIADNIRLFFSYQWQQQFPFDIFNFTKMNYPVICPQGQFLFELPHFIDVLCITNFVYFISFLVPIQSNGFDCGLFVCRYAAGLHKIRHELFTYSDIYSTSSPLLEKLTQNSNFQFHQRTVTEFRIQLGTLIDNLSSVYKFGKLPAPPRGKKAYQTKMAARSNRIKKLSTAHKRCGKRKADMVDSKLKPSVQITIADLPSDNDSVLELLHEDPFMPSPQKNAPDKNVRMESSILEDNVKVEVQSSASVGNTKAVAIKQMDDSTFVESVLQETEDVKWQNNAIVDDYPAFGHYGSQAEAIVEDSAAFTHWSSPQCNPTAFFC